MASPDPEKAATDASPTGWLMRSRSVVLSGAVTIGLVLWVLLMPVATISFVTNPITELSFRRVSEMSIPDVWAYQLDNLPEVPASWAMTTAFAGAMGVAFACIVLGCWLLLSPGTDGPRRGERRRV